MTDTISAPTTADLFRQALAISRRDLGLTKEQEQNLLTTRQAWESAREQQSVASRARKDKDQKEAEAAALVEATRQAYGAAKEVEEQAESKRNFDTDLVMERVLTGIVEETVREMPEFFEGVRSLRYVNSQPTEEFRPARYGGGDERVWKTTIDDQPVPGYLRAVEAGDYRFAFRNGRLTELSLTVQSLTDETYEDGGRKERYEAEVRHHVDHYPKTEHRVDLSWPGIGTRSIDDREEMVKVYTIGIKVARIAERIVKEVI